MLKFHARVHARAHAQMIPRIRRNPTQISIQAIAFQANSNMMMCPSHDFEAKKPAS